MIRVKCLQSSCTCCTVSLVCLGGGKKRTKRQSDELRTSSVLSRAVCIRGRVPFAGRPLKLRQLSQLFLLVCRAKTVCQLVKMLEVETSQKTAADAPHQSNRCTALFYVFVPVHDSFKSFQLFVSAWVRPVWADLTHFHSSSPRKRNKSWLSNKKKK